MAEDPPRSGMESPFASIRELNATERRLTATIEGVKNELLTAIRAEDDRHEATHKAMRALGEERHRRIEDFLGKEALDDAKRTGMMTVGVGAIRVLRALNEFRWLLAILAVAIGLLLGGFDISIQSQVAP